MTTPTVLLTGSTGFIGGATLARLVETRPDCRVLLLVRAASPEAAADRVRKSLARFLSPERVESALRSCEIICGDLTDPATLGNARLDDATHVLHLASQKKLAAR